MNTHGGDSSDAATVHSPDGSGSAASSFDGAATGAFATSRNEGAQPATSSSYGQPGATAQQQPIQLYPLSPAPAFVGVGGDGGPGPLHQSMAMQEAMLPLARMAPLAPMGGAAGAHIDMSAWMPPADYVGTAKDPARAIKWMQEMRARGVPIRPGCSRQQCLCIPCMLLTMCSVVGNFCWFAATYRHCVCGSLRKHREAIALGWSDPAVRLLSSGLTASMHHDWMQPTTISCGQPSRTVQWPNAYAASFATVHAGGVGDLTYGPCGTQRASVITWLISNVSSMSAAEINASDLGGHGITLLHLVAQQDESLSPGLPLICSLLLQRQSDLSLRCVKAFNHHIKPSDTALDVAQRRGNVRMVEMMHSSLEFMGREMQVRMELHQPRGAGGGMGGGMGAPPRNPLAGPQHPNHETLAANAVAAALGVNALAAATIRRLSELVAADNLCKQFEAAGDSVESRLSDPVHTALTRHVGSQNWHGGLGGQESVASMSLSLADALLTELQRGVPLSPAGLSEAVDSVTLQWKQQEFHRVQDALKQRVHMRLGLPAAPADVAIGVDVEGVVAR